MTVNYRELDPAELLRKIQSAQEAQNDHIVATARLERSDLRLDGTMIREASPVSNRRVEEKYSMRIMLRSVFEFRAHKLVREMRAEGAAVKQEVAEVGAAAAQITKSTETLQEFARFALTSGLVEGDRDGWSHDLVAIPTLPAVKQAKADAQAQLRVHSMPVQSAEGTSREQGFGTPV